MGGSLQGRGKWRPQAVPHHRNCRSPQPRVPPYAQNLGSCRFKYHHCRQETVTTSLWVQGSLWNPPRYLNHGCFIVRCIPVYRQQRRQQQQQNQQRKQRKVARIPIICCRFLGEFQLTAEAMNCAPGLGRILNFPIILGNRTILKQMEADHHTRQHKTHITTWNSSSSVLWAQHKRENQQLTICQPLGRTTNSTPTQALEI